MLNMHSTGTEATDEDKWISWASLYNSVAGLLSRI